MEGGAKATKPSAKPPAGRWRLVLAWVLVVIASIIGIVAMLNVWVKRQALDTSNWTSASTQLLENKEIRSALATYLVNELYSNVDVSANVEERLPKNIKPIAPLVSSALQQLTYRAAYGLLGRPRVIELWKDANRVAHKTFIAIIEDDTRILEQQNGEVALDLRPVLERLSEQGGFGAKLVAKLPPDAGRLVIMKKDSLKAAQTGVRVIKVLSFFLALLALALYALAVWLARGRRRSLLLGIGIAVLLVGVLLLMIRRIVSNEVVDALVAGTDARAAASSTVLIMTELLRNAAINLIVYGSVLIVGVLLSGPSRLAVRIRRFLAPTLREHPIIVYGLVALGLLIFLVTGPLDLSRLIPMLVLFGLAFVGVEVFRRQTAREFPDAGREPASST